MCELEEHNPDANHFLGVSRAVLGCFWSQDYIANVSPDCLILWVEPGIGDSECLYCSDLVREFLYMVSR